MTPNNSDDEFDSTTLNSSWSFSTAGAALTPAASTITTYSDVGGTGAASNMRYALHSNGRRSWILFQGANSGANLFLTKSVSPPTDMLIWARCCFRVFNTAAVGDENTIGVTLAANTAGYPDNANKVALYLNESDTGVRQLEYTKTVAGTPTSVATTLDVDPNGAQAFEYVALHKLGTTYHAWACAAAGNWMWLGSTSFAATVAHMGIVFGGGTSNNKPGTLVNGVDFFRRLDTSEFNL